MLKRMRTYAFTCPNEKCRRDFPKPITIHNVLSNTEYEGCPFCMTELSQDTKRKRDLLMLETKTKKEPVEQKLAENELTHVHLETQECPHYFAYLSERSRNEEIPDHCMTCLKIIECMRSAIEPQAAHVKSKIGLRPENHP